MRLSKKMAAVSTAVAMLMALGGTSAMASRTSGDGGNDDRDHKVTICHVDGQGRFHKITVDHHAVPAHLRHGDKYPDDHGRCPRDGDHTDGDGGGGGY